MGKLRVFETQMSSPEEGVFREGGHPLIEELNHQRIFTRNPDS